MALNTYIEAKPRPKPGILPTLPTRRIEPPKRKKKEKVVPFKRPGEIPAIPHRRAA